MKIKNQKKAIFGKTRIGDFYMDPTYINLNHGSYGYVPRTVLNVKRKYQEQAEYNTQKWFRFDAQKKIIQVRKQVSQVLNTDWNNVFLVQNASDGFNSFAKSIKWVEGDVIVLPNVAYAMARKTIQYIAQRYKLKIITIEFTLQDFQSAQSILLKLQNTINKYEGKIRLAITDHISSVPGVIFPLKQIIQFYHEKEIPVLVDGAHAICQADIDISDLKPDGYLSNFHKWAYAPKNAAFLYISDAFLNVIHPNIIGNFYGQGLARQYFWTGTRDYTSYLAVSQGLNYYNSFGPGAVRQYCHSLTVAAGKRMAEIWKTRVFTSDERLIGYLNNIEVPSKDINLCVQIANQMLEQLNCYPVFYQFEGKVYTRISAQVYNQLSDYEFAAQKFLEILIGAEKNAKSIKNK